MSKYGILNMIVGFLLLILAGAGGSFVALDLNYRFLNHEVTPQWVGALEAASHGHTALFGVVQILVGLTIPYGRLTKRVVGLQFVFLTSGAIAMGPGMLMKAASGPAAQTEWLGLFVGGLLSLWMLGLILHVVGLITSLSAREYRSGASK